MMEKLQEENSGTREKLEQFEKVKSAEAVVMREKLESLQKLLEDRNRQVEELWNVIQMLDDGNMMLKSQADKWEKKEKQLRKEITDLKPSSATDVQEINMFVYYSTSDWKEKFHQERLEFEEKVKGKHRRWRQRVVKTFSKHVQDKNISVLDDGIKL